jgi:hypothetical protein
MHKDPLFDTPLDEPPILKQKEIAQKQVKKLHQYAFVTEEDAMENPLRRYYQEECLMMKIPDTCIKYSLHGAVNIIKLSLKSQQKKFFFSF